MSSRKQIYFQKFSAPWNYWKEYASGIQADSKRPVPPKYFE